MAASLNILVIRSSLEDWQSMKKECIHARHSNNKFGKKFKIVNYRKAILDWIVKCSSGGTGNFQQCLPVRLNNRSFGIFPCLLTEGALSRERKTFSAWGMVKKRCVWWAISSGSNSGLFHHQNGKFPAQCSNKKVFCLSVHSWIWLIALPFPSCCCTWRGLKRHLDTRSLWCIFIG